MDFTQKQRIYAELIVAHGLNVQPGQVVNLSTEAIHRDFIMMVAEAAYDRGAKHVHVDLTDQRLSKLRINKSKEDDLKYVPPYVTHKYRDMVDDKGANLKLIGSEDPDLLSDLDPKRVNTVRLHNHLAVKYFYDEGIGKSLVHWNVAAAATPKWGKKVFPDLSEEEACAALWEEIFRTCRADQPNCLELWKEHNDKLHHRAEALNALNIKEIHFTGPGTDLFVGLSERAKFKGGGDMGPWGVEYEPNLPTEEVFTTPDNRVAYGRARATRPFMVNGKMIKGLEIEFEDGQVKKFSAEEGEETFREYIASDEGANRLGEVALVGIDSPIFQSGLVYEEILFDENAACHIAVGSAYKFCIEGGDSMSEEELKAVGCNTSTVHTDFMISSEEVDVSASTYDGQTVKLIEKGRWTESFA